jgi:hypothetical protein
MDFFVCSHVTERVCASTLPTEPESIIYSQQTQLFFIKYNQQMCVGWVYYTSG